MGGRVNYSGLVIAGIGFFSTRFTVALATYDQPLQYGLANIFPLGLGLGVAAFGVALTVADVESWFVRTTALWCTIGTGTMLLIVLVSFVGSNPGELPDLAVIRSQTTFANAIIGGSVGGTLTGLYAGRNRRQQRALRQQTDRLETLNRMLRHEVLNAVAVIRGFTETESIAESDARAAIEAESLAIEQAVEEVKRLTNGPGSGGQHSQRLDLDGQLRSSLDRVRGRYPEADVALETADPDLTVFADEYLEEVFTNILENAIQYTAESPPSVSISVTATRTDARVSVRDEGPGLPENQQRLLERGQIQEYDDPGSGFGLNLVRLLVEGYGGSIETDVDDSGTTITVVLPRAEPPGFGIQANDASLAGVRPNAPQLVVVLAASLLAGVAYGVVSEELGGSVAAIGVFYGVSDPIIGWITHEFHSLVFGFVFAGLVSLAPARYRESVWTYVLIGLGWGLVLWTGAAGFIAPTWLVLLGFDAAIPTFQGFLLLAHLAWGGTLGLLTVGGYRYATPWIVKTGERLRDLEDWFEIG